MAMAMAMTVSLCVARPAMLNMLPPAVIGLNGTRLAQVQDMIASGTLPVRLQPALKSLTSEADNAMTLKGSSSCPEDGPWTVTMNPMTPPSDDKHDFSYVSTYAWPCNAPCPQKFGAHCSDWWRRPSWLNKTAPYPDWSKCDNSTGLPWISHDGFGQPQGQHDTDCSVKMATAVKTLSIAAFLTKNEDYAAKAADVLYTWFINPSTAMNPNLAFAAYIPGHSNGSSSGIIATSFRWNNQVTDAARLLAWSKSWSLQNQSIFDSWNAKYVDWLVSSSMGRGEGRATNNHFTWYTVQSLTLALDTNNLSLASELALAPTLESTPGALHKQINTNGLLPLEAHRDAGATYSTMDVLALFTLAQSSMNVKTAPNYWQYRESDGTGSIRAALDYLVSYGINSSKTWPFDEEGIKDWADFPWTNLALPMRIAAIVYKEPKYEGSISKLPWKDGGAHQYACEDPSLLLYPVAAKDSC